MYSNGTMMSTRGNRILGSINDTEAFATDDLGNRVGQVTQRDGVGKVHVLWLGLTKKTA